MSNLFIQFIFVLTVFCVISQAIADSAAEDTLSHDGCVGAKLEDRVLFHYSFTFQNDTAGPALRRNQQPYYIHMPEVQDTDGMYTHLLGMCENSTRRITFETLEGTDLFPIVQWNSPLFQLNERVVVDLHMHKITIPEEYQIFDALKAANISLALDLIEAHQGINAMDEYGQTPLMIAVSRQYQPVVAALLNTRRPLVDINLVKASGFSALFYAVEKASPGILQALLRRGADPNLAVTQDGSRGNTPLHYACMLEKVKHATLLLEYGANPYLQNEHGQIPYKMIPGDAVVSTKRQYRQIFDEAYKKIEQMQEQELSGAGQTQGEL